MYGLWITYGLCLLVSLIRSLPEMEEVRSRLDANSESVMDKSALNDDEQHSEPSSGLRCPLDICCHAELFKL